jgi:L-Ala-D/L-Glu epimerase
MKITRIKIQQITLKLKVPYTIAYETYDTVTNVFVRVETDRGIVGFGCAAPDEHVTGETPELIVKDFQTIISPIVINADPLRYSLILDKVNKTISNHPGTIAALDMALFDILGKVSGLPLWKLLGGFRDKIITSVTIGILSENETIARAKEFVGQGFKAIKLKCGLDVESDIIRTLKVRETIGEKIVLRFDANQGYSVAQALQFIEHVKKANIEFIEQPTKKEKPELLGKVKVDSTIPIMADESLSTTKEALNLVANNLVDLFNIKLMKVGGMQKALQINAIAQAAGLDVMTGCMDESALAIAAGLHFTLANPNIKYADLDGHFDLIGDPAEGSVVLHDGYLHPTDKPGLGINL